MFMSNPCSSPNPCLCEIPVVQQMKRYPAYKDSGIKWLGKIPVHWKAKKLKYCDEIIMGQSPNSDDYNTDYEGLPFLQGNADFTQLYPKPRIWCDKANKKTEIDDILLSVRAPIGAVNIADQKYGIGRGLCAIRPTETHKKFLYYIALCLNDELNSMGTGSTFTAISIDEIRNIAIPRTPSLGEQQTIAAYLDHKTRLIDTYITKKQQQVERLQAYRTALINQAVTKGLNPDAPMKDSGIEWLGEIPVHWRMRKLKYVTQVLRGKFSHRPRNDERLYDGEFPFIQTGDVSNAKKYINSYNQTLNSLGYSVSKEFPKGTLVMTIAANIGDLAILNFNACFPDSIVGFKPTKDIEVDYLYYNLKAMRGEFFRTSIINTQLNLNIDRISNLPTAVPPLDEQEAIIQFIDQQTAKIDNLITKTQRQIDRLQAYRTSLISDAVTGKIDVRNYRDDT